MNALHPTDLAAQVVAWHNRHPLARRIGAQHVHSMGYVVLPFFAPAASAMAASAHAPSATQSSASSADPTQGTGATLRERATARAQQEASAAPAAAAAVATAAGATAPRAALSTGPLKAAFGENSMAPLSGAKVARWVAHHGAALPTPAGDAPVRQVKADSGIDRSQLMALWVQTAQIEVGARSVRLLIAHGPRPEVLGRRLWSLPRLAGVVALATALAALGYAVFKPPAGRVAERPVPVQAQPAGQAAPAAATMAEAALAPASAAASAVTAVIAASAAAATASAPALNLPLDVDATAGRIVLPSLGPRIDQRRLAAQSAHEQAASQAAAKPAAAAPAQAVAVPAVAAPPAVDPSTTARSGTAGGAARTGTAFAVSTRLLRTHAESQQVASAMRALLVTPDSPQIQVEVLPAGADFRVVGWPYGQRAEAEKVRARLATRGLKVEVVGF